ncbi:MAG TPA: hypothetical protein VKJ00_00530, partial [Thermoanaerobaculia bacterium]|nr:hypothetical protein [Thermoanaerobaculia bacterium]
MKKTSAAFVVGLILAAAPALGQEATPQSLRDAAPAAGLAVNLPLVARLIGAGPTLYISTVDVQNNAGDAAQVDWYLS